MFKGVVFFRGINVGGKNILPMKALKALLQELGYTNVQTVIQSGNVIFETTQFSDKLHVTIAEAVNKQFGFKPSVIVFSQDTLKHIFNTSPYENEDGKLLHYFLMQTSPCSPDFSMLDKVKLESEEYCLIDNVLYLHAPDGIGRSKLVSKIEKAMGVAVTARNQNTLIKLINLI